MKKKTTYGYRCGRDYLKDVYIRNYKAKLSISKSDSYCHIVILMLSN